MACAGVGCVGAAEGGGQSLNGGGGHGYLNIDEHCIFILSLLHRPTPDAHT